MKALMVEMNEWARARARTAENARGPWGVCARGRRVWETWGGRDDTRGAMTDGIER